MNDIYVGSCIAIEIESERNSSNVLFKRFYEKKTIKEIAIEEGVSDSKISKLISSMIDDIKNDSNLMNYVRRGYNYTRRCM